MAERYVKEREKAGDLRPDHEKSFGHLLDDIAPPAPPPPKKPAG